MGDRVNIAKYFLLEPAPPEKLQKIRKNNLQMAITRPTRGLRSSSFAYPIQVGHAGAHGTTPDRFRAIPDDFLMKSRQKYQNISKSPKTVPKTLIFAETLAETGLFSRSAANDLSHHM